jgi:hypothetical protein
MILVLVFAFVFVFAKVFMMVSTPKKFQGLLWRCCYEPTARVLLYSYTRLRSDPSHAYFKYACTKVCKKAQYDSYRSC